MINMSEIKVPFLYKIKCIDCNSFIAKEGLIPELICPINESHQIDQNYLAVLDDVNLQKFCNKDYKKHRKELIERIVASGNQMNMSELYYAAAHFCLPKENRDMFFSLEEQIELGKEFHRRSTESRFLRWTNSLVNLYNYISLEDSFIIGREVEILAFRYLNYGVEGTPEGDEEGLFDYVMSISGTSYENSGLSKKTMDILVSGVTMQDVAAILMKKLRAED
jgi:hypothetical protein